MGGQVIREGNIIDNQREHELTHLSQLCYRHQAPSLKSKNLHTTTYDVLDGLIRFLRAVVIEVPVFFLYC